MNGRRWATTTAYLALMLATVGCSEDWCRDQYDLTVQPPDGPDVIIQPDGNYLELLVDGTAQPVNLGETAFIEDNRCELRGDLIGIRSLRFDFYPEGNPNPAAAHHVKMESDDVMIDVVESAYGTIHWRFAQKSEPFWTCTATPVGGFASELPKEFHELSEASLIEEDLEEGDKVDLQVQLPG